MKPNPVRVVAFVLLALAAAHCRAEDLPARIGSTAITLPVPSGFAAAGAKAPELRSLGETMTAASNRLLEIFLSDQDLGAAAARRQPTLSRYFMAQTLRQTEGRTIEPRDFEKLKNILRTQSQELANKVAPSVQAQVSSAAKTLGDKAGVPDASVRVGEMKIGEVFDETPTSISVTASTKYAVVANGKKQEIPMTMAMTTLLVRGKIVYFYTYSVMKSSADSDWVRAQTKAWVPRALASNR